MVYQPSPVSGWVLREANSDGAHCAGCSLWDVLRDDAYGKEEKGAELDRGKCQSAMQNQ